jgi:hypothetical protein
MTQKTLIHLSSVVNEVRVDHKVGSQVAVWLHYPGVDVLVARPLVGPGRSVEVTAEGVTAMVTPLIASLSTSSRWIRIYCADHVSPRLSQRRRIEARISPLSSLTAVRSSS